MAESNRYSGQTAAPSGVPGSGRRAPVAPGGSGRRLPVQPPEAEPAPLPESELVPHEEQQPQPRPPRSGRRPPLPEADTAPEAQPQALTASARMTAQAYAAGTRTTRRAPAVGGVSSKRKVRGVGKELMICFGVIAVLAVAAVVLFFVQRSHNVIIIRKIEVLKEIFERNMKLGFDTYQRAENAGLLFVTGKDDKATDDKLFGAFKSDSKIYNVIFDRIYKDKKNQTKTEQRSMFKDRLRIESIESKGREENGVSANYGFAEDKTIPIVVAKKFIKPVQGDSANLGGAIMVIAKAESDDVFENAKKPRAAPAAPEKDKVEKKE